VAGVPLRLLADVEDLKPVELLMQLLDGDPAGSPDR
jgi:hypothetical protein